MLTSTCAWCVWWAWWVSGASLSLCSTVVGVTSRKGSLTGSLVAGGPGLHIFLAETSQCGAPCSILHMALSSSAPPLPLDGARLPSMGVT